MSPFNFDEQFPTFKRMGRALPGIPKRIGRALPGIPMWLGRTVIVAPVRGTFRFARRRYRPILAVAIILVIAHGAATFLLGRRVKAEIAAIKARGEPVSVADLARPEIPDSENAAVIYAKAFEAISGPGAKADLEKPGYLSPYKLKRNPELLGEATRIAARYKNAVLLIEEGASRPRCQFPIDWEDGLRTLYERRAKLRWLAMLLRGSALLDAREGRIDDSLRYIGLGFKLTDSLKHEPIMNSQLVKVTIISVSARGLRWVMEYGSITEPQARQLFDVLAKIDVRSGYLEAMHGERVLDLRAFEDFRKDPKQFAELVAPPEEPDYRLWGLAASYPWRPLLYADELTYLRLLNANIEAGSLSYREMISKGEPAIPAYALVSKKLLYTSPCRVGRSLGRATAMAAGSQIILALQAYKDRYDSYPETLDELRAKLGWKLPEDPFSRKDFVYKPQGKGFLLYSIGENLRDDGAVDPTAFDDAEHDDIVWRWNGKTMSGRFL